MLDSGARKQSVDTNLLEQLYFRSMLCHLASLVGRAEAQAPFISALYSGKKGIKLNIYIYIYIYIWFLETLRYLFKEKHLLKARYSFVYFPFD